MVQSQHALTRSLLQLMAGAKPANSGGKASSKKKVAALKGENSKLKAALAKAESDAAAAWQAVLEKDSQSLDQVRCYCCCFACMPEAWQTSCDSAAAAARRQAATMRSQQSTAYAEQAAHP